MNFGLGSAKQVYVSAPIQDGSREPLYGQTNGTLNTAK